MEVDTPMGGAGGGDVPMQGGDQSMHTDDSMNTTITPSTLQQAMPDYSMNTTITPSTLQQAMPDYTNGAFASPPISQVESRPHTSYSDSQYSRPASHSMSHGQGQGYSDIDNSGTPPQQYRSSYGKPNSRPPSAMSGTSQGGGGGGGYGSYEREVASKAADASGQPKVIIKVGMVGDAQIGKTSLMVKYVEGSWDEDYVQTLGMFTKCNRTCIVLTRDVQVSISWRRQSRSATPKSLSRSGIWVDSASS